MPHSKTLDENYLILGLNALARAHTMDYFRDGHHGAAVVAAYFLCREVALEDGVTDAIRGLIDEQWASHEIFAPFPDEVADPDGEARIIESLERGIGQLRQAGHNVIFPSLALKAFQQMPEVLTRSRVDGICALIDSFTPTEIELDENDHIPDLGSGSAGAELILSEMLKFIVRFDGWGQGWSGHLLTYGRALLDLREMGYESTAEKGAHAFKLNLKRGGMLLAEDLSRPEHPPTELRPVHREYWEPRKTEPLGLGHVFKYPYAFYGLMAMAEDPELKRRCHEQAFHIL